VTEMFWPSNFCISQHTTDNWQLQYGSISIFQWQILVWLPGVCGLRWCDCYVQRLLSLFRAGTACSQWKYTRRQQSKRYSFTDSLSMYNCTPL